MRLGLDFDNTIVSYDLLFHQVAVEHGLVPRETEQTKLAVRTYLRNADKEDEWTILQGRVYGEKMPGAIPFEGALNTIRTLRQLGIEIFIISHRTRYPYLGERFDLHEAAQNWVNHFLLDDVGPLVNAENIYFHEEKAQKIDRIAQLNCDVFVDDLPEILMADTFPAKTFKILFDPRLQAASSPDYTILSAWPDLINLLDTLTQKRKAASA
ncbi:MAG: haloacid dehalogenase-like hydrolase [Pseudomonadota bacterium]